MRKHNNFQKIKLIILPLLSLFLIFNCGIFQNSENDNGNLSSIPKSVTESHNNFAMDLFQEINENEADSNIFISPISAEFALTMTMNGADGQTFDEMHDVLGYSSSDLKTINSACKTLIEELQNLEGGVELSLANSIWYRDTYTLQDSFETLNKDYFQAKVEGMDFSQEQQSLDNINGWVSDKTEGKIEELVTRIPPQSMMFLINAIYFNGNWKYQFDEEQTSESQFTLKNGNSVSCQMMSIKQEYPYYSDNSVQAIELPYANENYVMTVILPDHDTGINSFIKDFTRNDLENIVTNFEKDSINLYFPKLELDYSRKMNESLKSLGMEKAFNGNIADFSNMFENIEDGLFISKVKQKSYLNVDENGTEATAATAVVVYRSAGGNEEIYMRLNRPFVFFIREKQTGTILFSGRIMDPG